MKKLILFSLAALLFGCSNRSKIDKNIYEWVQANFHDPKSYEYISTTPADTIYSSDDIESRITFAKYEVESYTGRIADDREGLERDRRDGLHIYDETLKYNQAKLVEYKREVDSLEVAKKDFIAKYGTHITKYVFNHKCRAKVPLGGLMLKTFTFTTDSALSILSWVEQKEDGNNAL